MGLRRLLEFATVGSALALAATAMPASANDGPPMPRPDYGAPMAGPADYMPSRDDRERWLAECSDRLAGDTRHMRKRERIAVRDRAWSSCERYYDDYYAYYDDHYQRYASSYGPATRPRPVASYDPDCVPCDRPMTGGSGRECTETVEYEYVDVPVRRRAPAPAPTKRIKVVPDKRIKLK